ncbi:MAG: GH25 family lysozyme [Bacteroidia bacterium]
MKKLYLLFAIVLCINARAQTCGTGGCPVNDTGTVGANSGLFPLNTFATTSSSWSTVSVYMNGGNYTLFNVISGDTYEWTYCSNFGGIQGWDAELTLFDNSTGTTLCYNDNCGLSGCPNAPYISWTATFTGTVKLLTTVSGCTTNSGSPYSTLVWRDASGAVSTQVLGIDISNLQGTIDWTQVAGSGVSFAYAKATEGLTFTDAYYVNNTTQGESNGLYMGAYHFAHPDVNPSGAVAEANYFLGVAQPYIISCELPPALDYEVSPLLTSAQQTQWINDWCNTVQTATGIAPVVYTDQSIAASLQSSVNTWGLWIADYDNSPTAPPASTGVWTSWVFKQYWDAGTVAGVSGNVDQDVFNGDITALQALMGCPTTGISQYSNLNTNILVYPNPTSQLVHLTISPFDNEKMNSVEIYNTIGECAHRQIVKSSNSQIDVSDLSEGVYQIIIHYSQFISTKRLVIVR